MKLAPCHDLWFPYCACFSSPFMLHTYLQSLPPPRGSDQTISGHIRSPCSQTKKYLAGLQSALWPGLCR